MRGAQGAGYIIFAALLLAFCSAANSGEKPRGLAADKAARRWNEFRHTGSGSWCLNRERGSGAARMLFGGKTARYPGSREAAARAFLAENADMFGLPQVAARSAASADGTSLVLLRQTPTLCGTRLTFRQFHNGLPVYGAYLDVLVDDAGAILFAASKLHPDLNVDVPPGLGLRVPRITGTGAAQNGGPEMVVFVDEFTGNARAAWRMLDEDEQHDPCEIVIDAASGAIVHRVRLVLDSDPCAVRVFNPNPVNKLNNTSLRDQNDANTAIPLAAYDEVALDRLDPPIDGVYSLAGEFVEMADVQAPAIPPATSPDGCFAFLRNDDGFEDVMCYYHITEAQKYIQSLGFTTVNNRRITVDAHGLAGIKQACYAVSDQFPFGAGFIAFGGDYGTDVVDMAEDADVIVHEYAHSIQDNQQPGRYFEQGDAGYGNETGAMGEGFADYFAASRSFDASVAHGFDPAVIAEWAFVPDGLRRVDTIKRYPDNLWGLVHLDGEIWSACLWQMRAAFGPAIADRIIIQSHFLVPPAPLFRDGADAIIAADIMLYGGDHAEAIKKIFLSRGIYQVDLRDDGEEFRSFSPTTILVGNSITIRCRIRNADAYVPVGPFVVRFHVSSDATISSEDVSLGETTIQTIDPNAFIELEWTGVISSDVPPGTYHVGWLIDADNQVPEFDELNNAARKLGYQLVVEWPPTLSIEPTSVDFGTVFVGQFGEASITVKNIGSGTLTGSASGLAAPFSFATSATYSLDAGESKPVVIRFLPAAEGTFTASVAFSGGGNAVCGITGIACYPKVETPAITPEGGSFISHVTVASATPTPLAVIYYTTDGTEPTRSSTRYAGPFILSENATVSVVAVRSGYLDSDIASEAFNVVPSMLIIEGPTDRGEPSCTSGGGSFRINIFGENFVQMGGMQIAFTCRDAEGNVTPVRISTEDGNPLFGGQAIFPNPQLFDPVFPVFTDERLVAGFASLGADRDVGGKTLLMSVVVDYPATLGVGPYEIEVNPTQTMVASGAIASPYRPVNGGMMVMGWIAVTGPADSGNLCTFAGGGTFTVSIYGEHLRNVGGVQIAPVFIDSHGTPSPHFRISSQGGNQLFGGLSIYHNTAVFSSIFPLFDAQAGCAGLLSLDGDIDLLERTRLMTITYEYTDQALQDIYTIGLNPDLTLVAGNLGNIDFAPIPGNAIIRLQWPVPGDATFDCAVNILDLLAVRTKLGQDTSSGGNCIVDVNRDGKINILDLIFIRARLNTKCE